VSTVSLVGLKDSQGAAAVLCSWADLPTSIKPSEKQTFTQAGQQVSK